jgi:TRAP-type C4-dicarboxylate transport system substrate-binding protein
LEEDNMKLLRTAALTLSLLASSLSATAQEFRMLSSWDKNYPYNPIILDPFMKNIETATNGRMKFVVSGPETVPPFEQLEPVAAGVFQFLFTSGAYHFGTTPLMLAVEGIDADLDAVRKAGLADYLDKHYQKLGLKLVAMPITAKGAYHLILKQPVSPNGDLAGRKIRGTPSHAPIIKMMGAAMVTLPPAEIYTGLDKGVVDGAAWPMIGVLDYRWNEVAKYLLRPGYGVNYEPIFMNLAAWNKLSSADQKIITDVARKIEDVWFKESVNLWDREEKTLIAMGMQVTRMGPEQQAKMSAALSEGLWELSAAKNPKDIADLRQFVRSKGLSK